MNYAKVFNVLVDETAKYLVNNNLKAMVLGISGGLDSTVTAAICHEVELRHPEIRFIGVSLPCNSNSDYEKSSANRCMQGFCKPGNCWTENLQKEYMLMKATCDLRGDSTDISQGNIKARLRMIYLYNLASINKGIVIDTDNLTEHYLGFFTIHGDVADFNPIGGLWKHEVYGLAKYLLYDYYGGDDLMRMLSYKEMALKDAIGIMPTDGNGVNDLGDMGQIAPAFTHDPNIEAYTKVDDIIKKYIYAVSLPSNEQDEIIQNLRDKYDTQYYNTVDNIINRIKSTEYKRNRLPVVIDRTLYRNKNSYN